MPTRVLVDSVPARSWPQWRATMLEWQGIEFRILKLHSYTAYIVAGASVGGHHGYPLSYAF
jgi:hypothetical protein